MPRYKTHLVGGLGAFLLVLSATTATFGRFSTNNLIICLTLSLLGSLFPDIDIHSQMQKLFFRGAFLGAVGIIIMQQWEWLFILAGATFLVTIIRHRTITHQPWFLVAMPGFLVLYMAFLHKNLFHHAVVYYLFFVGGALSHVLLDRSVTKVKKLLVKWRMMRWR